MDEEQGTDAFFQVQRSATDRDRSRSLPAVGWWLGHCKKMGPSSRSMLVIVFALGILIVCPIASWPLRWMDMDTSWACEPKLVSVELEPGSVLKTTTYKSSDCHKLIVQLGNNDDKNNSTIDKDKEGINLYLNSSDCPLTRQEVEHAPVFVVVLFFTQDCDGFKPFQMVVEKTSNATRGEEMAAFYRRPFIVYDTYFHGKSLQPSPSSGTAGIICYWMLNCIVGIGDLGLLLVHFLRIGENFYGQRRI